MKNNDLVSNCETITRIKIDDLLPYARNSRVHSNSQIDHIAASMKEWGWTNPILVSEDRTIIAGHGRVLAARKLGLIYAPCIIAKGWTKTQIRAYVIADNRLAELAEWDHELLALELEDIRLDDFDINLVGFDSEQMEKIFNESDGSPNDFKEVGEDIETSYRCPKCGYRWSGKASANGTEDAE